MKKIIVSVVLFAASAFPLMAQEEISDTLDAVILTAEAPRMVSTKDGNVKIIVAGSYMEKLSELRDVLRRTPGMNVNNDNVEVSGKGIPMVIIDGWKGNFDDGTSSSISGEHCEY